MKVRIVSTRRGPGGAQASIWESSPTVTNVTASTLPASHLTGERFREPSPQRTEATSVSRTTTLTRRRIGGRRRGRRETRHARCRTRTGRRSQRRSFDRDDRSGVMTVQELFGGHEVVCWPVLRPLRVVVTTASSVTPMPPQDPAGLGQSPTEAVPLRRPLDRVIWSVLPGPPGRSSSGALVSVVPLRPAVRATTRSTARSQRSASAVVRLCGS